MVVNSQKSMSYYMKIAVMLMESVCFAQVVFILFYFFILQSQENMFTNPTIFTIILGLLMIATIAMFILIPYGFLYQKAWVQPVLFIMFAMGLVINLVGSFTIPSLSLALFLFFAGFLCLSMFMLLSPVTTYLVHNYASKYQSSDDMVSDYLKIGEYILHRQQVTRRNGTMGTLYYFCKGSSEKGIPCNKPDQYELKYNKRTQVPYLKKKKDEK